MGKSGKIWTSMEVGAKRVQEGDREYTGNVFLQFGPALNVWLGWVSFLRRGQYIYLGAGR